MEMKEGVHGQMHKRLEIDTFSLLSVLRSEDKGHTRTSPSLRDIPHISEAAEPTVRKHAQILVQSCEDVI